MIEFIQAVIVVTVEVLCCKIFFDIFLIDKFKIKRYRYIKYGLLLGLVFILAVISVLQIKYIVVKSIGVLLAIFFFMGIYYKGSFNQILFCTVGYYSILTAIDKIMLTVIQYIIPQQFGQVLQEPVKVTLIALICKSFLFLSVIVLNRKMKRGSSFYLLADTEWLRFLFYPILTVMTMLIFVMNSHQQEKYILLISFGMIVGNYILFYMIKDIVYKEKQMQELLVAEERLKNQTDMYIQMNQYNKERMLKIHEFKIHMNCIHGLLNVGDNVEALEYVKNINITWLEEMDIVRINHPVVNAVVNEKYKKAKKLRIPLILKINNLEELSLKNEDIVTLLANLLDNAIEAVEKIELEEKNIKLKMIYEYKKLLISVRNPVLENVQILENELITSKTENEDHGYGIINIKRAVEKYNGEYVFSCNKGYVTSTVIIRNI